MILTTARQLSLLFTAGCILFLTASDALSARQLLKPYHAGYRLRMGPLVIGSLKISLEVSADGNYTYRASTAPIGLAAVFRKDEITEKSVGKIDDKGIVPARYHYRHKKSNEVREVDLDFNWDASQVTNKSAGSEWTMSIPGGTQDKFSQQLALMVALFHGQKQAEFQVADGGLLKTYRYTEVEREPVSTPAGQYNAIKLARNKGDRPSRAELWFAPELNFLPVKISKREDDGDFLLELVSVNWPDKGKFKQSVKP